MAFTSGFFNGTDRKYDAIQISSMFDGIINDGVFSTIGDRFVVNVASGNSVTIGTGRAWFKHTWTYNDTPYPLQIDVADEILNRYDLIVLEMDLVIGRANEIKCIKGAPASSPVEPTPVQNSSIYQVPLASVYRKAASIMLTQADITQKVGKSSCPLVTAVNQSMTIDAIVAQWEAEFDNWMVSEQSTFVTWFNSIKNQLTTDAAGSLQKQVNELVDAMAGKETVVFGALGSVVAKWFGGVLANNGKIYCIPYNASSVLEIDTSKYEANGNYISTFGTVSGASKWSGGVLAPNGKIYCIPSSSTTIGVIDPVARTITTFGSLVAGDNKWFGGVLAPNGKIYCIPANSPLILVIDPSNDTTTTVAFGAGTYKWRDGVLAPNGKIYGIPYSAETILEIDPTTNTASTFGSGTMQSSSSKYSGGVLAPNGKIYCIPADAKKVLEVDPVTKVVSEIGTDYGSGVSRWLGGVYVNNCIYGIPSNSSTVLKIRDVMTVGNRLKNLEAEVGELSALNTNDKTSIVKSVNEIFLSDSSGWSQLRDTDVFIPMTQTVTAPNFEVKTTDILNSYRDLSSYLSVGMKIRLKQGGAYKYFFIVKIAGNVITLYGGTDYALTSTSMSDVAYSVVQAPHGFPIASNGLGIDFPIEEKTNENGKFIKYASGKMICYGSPNILVPANTQYTAATITLPASFTENDYVWTATQGVIHGATQLGMVTFGQHNTKSLGYFITHVKTDGVFASAQYIAMNYIAIGKWK